MKLSTSKILTQLSEQDRNKAELELSELHAKKKLLIQQQQASTSRIHQLNKQRDQAINNRNAASLLQAFNCSLHEQQSMLTLIQAALLDIDQQHQLLLDQFNIAFRKHYRYEKMHSSNQRQQLRQLEKKQQRQLDDIFAARHQTAAR